MNEKEFRELKKGQLVRFSDGIGTIYEIVDVTEWKYGGTIVPMKEHMILISPVSLSKTLLPMEKYILQIASGDRDRKRLELVNNE